jgi:hypothetical protein
MPDYALDEAENIALCEVLDRILNKGAVVMGEVTISVANIDLVYLALKVVISSIETARGMHGFEFYESRPYTSGPNGNESQP